MFSTKSYRWSIDSKVNEVEVSKALPSKNVAATCFQYVVQALWVPKEKGRGGGGTLQAYPAAMMFSTREKEGWRLSTILSRTILVGLVGFKSAGLEVLTEKRKGGGFQQSSAGRF
jgi:hypothetical protein